jgi:excisionase family DNA binding protein
VTIYIADGLVVMADDFNPSEWITTQEAARLTGYSVEYIRRLVRQGRVVAKKWLRDWIISRHSLLEYQRGMGELGRAKHDPWRTGARQKSDGAD